MQELLPTILPSKEHIQTLPVFKNLPMQQIQVINSLEQCHALEQELKSCAVLGFDSESKPTFKVGEVSTGPHLIQLATLDKAYLFQMKPAIWTFLAPIFASRDQIKVGFGLKNDAHLFRKKGIELNNVIELSKCFGHFGLKNPVGLKNAMALLFQVNFPKSKRISTSNWARKNLTPAQIDYAAADAYAPVLVFEELLRRDLLPKDIPNTSLKLRIRPSSKAANL
ncbi:MULTISPECIES: 3'-5' exonuclease [unclassified Acinetobacter]|uniref:3'-5' exonuclease n=1 Tax=unclassified Acinetobacter TaxID=196816 RepID=UPI001C210277|nr:MULTISPECIES: 3'-5' exonuclease [unclassified Acinetobacter]